MFQTKDVEKIKTPTMFSNLFFQNHVLYGIVWKNMVEPDRLQMTI